MHTVYTIRETRSVHSRRPSATSPAPLRLPSAPLFRTVFESVRRLIHICHGVIVTLCCRAAYLLCIFLVLSRLFHVVARTQQQRLWPRVASAAHERVASRTVCACSSARTCVVAHFTAEWNSFADNVTVELSTMLVTMFTFDTLYLVFDAGPRAQPAASADRPQHCCGPFATKRLTAST